MYGVINSLTAGFCNSNFLACHEASQGSIPRTRLRLVGQSTYYYIKSGTASAGDAHSLARRSHSPTAIFQYLQAV